MSQLAHRSQALFLEADVSNREHFVHEQDVRAQVSGDREAQPHPHAARVALDRRVHELRDVGELDDALHRRIDFPLLHAEDRAVQIDVLATRELIMESRSHLEQGTDPSSNIHPTRGRVGDPRQDLEERALASAVATDDPEDLAALDLERHTVKCPFEAGRGFCPAAKELPEAAHQGVSKHRVVSFAESVTLRYVLDDNGL